MDLATLTIDQATIDILMPGRNEPTGLKVTVRSKDSDEVKATLRRQQAKALKGGRNRLSPEDIEVNTLEILCASVASWEWTGSAKWDGQKPDCTPESVKAILADRRAWFIRDQIDQALADERLFSSASLNP